VFFPLGETGDRFGVPVDERDTIDVDWTIGPTLTDGSTGSPNGSSNGSSIHPDYRVVTTLATDGQPVTFEYRSRVDETALNSTPLYRALWSEAAGAQEDARSQEDKGFSPQRLQDWLGERLPDYMVPSAWVELERLPLTSHHC